MDAPGLTIHLRLPCALLHFVYLSSFLLYRNEESQLLSPCTTPKVLSMLDKQWAGTAMLFGALLHVHVVLYLIV